jgi:quinol monooxygenase YgiN
MIVVTGQVRFGDGEIERLKDALKRNVEVSRGDEGCELYHYAVDLSDPNLLIITEAYRDEESMERHNARLPELMAPLAGADIRGLSVKAYRAEFLKTVVGD